MCKEYFSIAHTKEPISFYSNQFFFFFVKSKSSRAIEMPKIKFLCVGNPYVTLFSLSLSLTLSMIANYVCPLFSQNPLFFFKKKRKILFRIPASIQFDENFVAVCNFFPTVNLESEKKNEKKNE